MVAPAAKTTQLANTANPIAGAATAAMQNAATQARNIAEKTVKGAGQQLAQTVDVKQATRNFARSQMKAYLRQFHSLLELSRALPPIYKAAKSLLCAGNIVTPEQVDAFCDNPDSLADNVVDKLFERIQDPTIFNILSRIPGCGKLVASLREQNPEAQNTIENSNTNKTVKVEASKAETTSTAASSTDGKQGLVSQILSSPKQIFSKAKKLIDSAIHDPRDEAARNEAIAKGGLKAKWLKLPQGARKGATYAGAGVAGLVALRIALKIVGFVIGSIKKLIFAGAAIFAGKKVMNTMSGKGKAGAAPKAKKSGGILKGLKGMLHQGAHNAINNATENTPTGQLMKMAGLDKKAKQAVDGLAAAA